jgi:hypothetical protein
VARCFVRAWAAVLGLVLAGSAAAEGLGRITAFVEGEARTWHTVTHEQRGRRVATASYSQGQRLAELAVQGHPVPRFTVENVLSVEARYLGPVAPGALPLSVDVTLAPEGLGGPFWTTRGAGEGAAELEIVTFDLLGRYGRLEAIFTARLCYRRSISYATDGARCRAVTGLIETELFVE